MAYTVCIDIGGTFTDCVVAASEDRGDGAQHLRIFKTPSTPEAFERGFMDVLKVAAEFYGLGLEGFLGQVDSIVHGSTVSTNALVEGKTRPAAPA